MNNIVERTHFWNISTEKAWEIMKRRGVHHTYGPASSVCDLTEDSIHGSRLKKLGIVTMSDLGLGEDNKYTFEDVKDACKNQGYFTINPSRVFNYVDLADNLYFGSKTAIIALMDEVTDRDGIPGVIYLQPDDEGYLYCIGFFESENNRALSKTARFLVGGE